MCSSTSHQECNNAKSTTCTTTRSIRNTSTNASSGRQRSRPRSRSHRQSDDYQQEQLSHLESQDPTTKLCIHEQVLTEVSSASLSSQISPTSRTRTSSRRLKRQCPPESTFSKTGSNEERDDENEHEHENDNDDDDEGTILYGFDISSFHPSTQFKLLVGTIFGFHAIYGYLQELLSIHIADRKFTLFISVIQLFGYAFWSWVLDCVRKRNLSLRRQRQRQRRRETATTTTSSSSITHGQEMEIDQHKSSGKDEEFIENGFVEQKHEMTVVNEKNKPPFAIFILMSFLRLVEVVMTNASTIYINFPMKTLMKSSKVSFTMLGGMTMGKRYRRRDFVAVAMLIFGLSAFIYADIRSASVLFRPVGVAMLVSTSCIYQLESYLCTYISYFIVHSFTLTSKKSSPY